MSSSWKIGLAFAGVFVAGVIFGGALAPRWLHPNRPVPPQDRPPFAERMMERLNHELELSPEQKGKIQPIVKRMEEETQRMRREGAITYRTVMDGLSAELALELSPEQKAKFEEMRKRFRERAERFRNEGRPGRPAERL